MIKKYWTSTMFSKTLQNKRKVTMKSFIPTAFLTTVLSLALTSIAIAAKPPSGDSNPSDLGNSTVDTSQIINPQPRWFFSNVSRMYSEIIHWFFRLLYPRKSNFQSFQYILNSPSRCLLGWLIFRCRISKSGIWK